MQYPEPSLHFGAFSSVWQGLTWTMDETDLSEADVGYMYNTGEDFSRSPDLLSPNDHPCEKMCVLRNIYTNV